jgi:bla regulator protein BlaR1
MNLPLLQHTLESAFAWTWKTSLQATVLIALVLLIQFAFAKILAPRWRYGLGLLVLLRLLLPAAPASPWSIFNLGTRPPANNQAVATRMALEASMPSTTYTMAALAPFAPGALLAPRAPHAPAAAKPAPPASVNKISICEMLPWIWLAGFAAMLAMVAWQQRNFVRRLGRWERVREPRVLELLEKCRTMLGVKRNVTVLAATGLNTPALFGITNPRLLLPVEMLERLDDCELRHVMFHELIHLQRRDLIVNWAMILLRAAHWFNPAVWLAFRRLRAEQELACDAAVMAHLAADERRQYGRTLLKLLDEFSPGNLCPGFVPFMTSKQIIKRRITMISNFKPTGRIAAGASVALLIALGSLTFTRAADRHSAAVAPSDLPLHPSGWWAGEHNAHDLTGANNGTLHAMSFGPGMVGEAFNFNGSNGYVSIPASASLDVGAGGGFTIDCWINPVDVATDQPLLEWNANTDDSGVGVHLWISVRDGQGSGPGCLFANLKNPQNNFILYTGPGLVTNGGFQHVALSYDKASGIARLYYNGAVVAEAGSPFPNYQPGTAAELDFGTRVAGAAGPPSPGTFFAGLMDEIGIYDRALSDAQIQYIYLAGRLGTRGAPGWAPPDPSPGLQATQAQARAQMAQARIRLAKAREELAREDAALRAQDAQMQYTFSSTRPDSQIQVFRTNSDGKTMTITADQLTIAGTADTADQNARSMSDGAVVEAEREMNMTRGSEALLKGMENYKALVKAQQTKVDRLREELHPDDVDPNSARVSPTLLTALQNQMIEADAMATKLNEELRVLTKLSPNELKQTLPTVEADSQLSALLLNKDAAEQKLVTLRASFGDQQPDVLTTTKLIEKLDQQIDERVKGLIRAIQTRADAQTAIVNKMQQQLNDAKEKNHEELARTRPYYQAKMDLDEMKKMLEVIQFKVEQERMNQEPKK